MNSAQRIILTFGMMAGLCHAHEFWIEPERYEATPGKVLQIGLRYGERFLGDIMPRVDEKIDKFMMVGPDGARPIVGRSGGLNSFTKPKKSGWHTLVYQSHRTTNEMPAEDFEAYLREEGLTMILPERARLGEASEPGKEVYSRCAKSLVLVGADDRKGYGRDLGLPLEITLQTNPVQLKFNHELVAKISYKGKPLKDARVVAVCQNKPSKFYEGTSNQNGQVRFKLPSEGSWMLTTIHMNRAPKDIDADWESLWASLTFKVQMQSKANPVSQD